MRFFKLLSIENMKLWKRTSSKVMLILIILLAIGVPSMMKFYKHSNGEINVSNASLDKGWKENTKKSLAEFEPQLNEMKKSKSRAEKQSQGTFEKIVAEGKYTLEHNIAPSKTAGIWQSLIKLNIQAGYAAVIALMMIITCSSQVAGEFTEGTIKLMVSRPYSRGEILSAKLISSLLYGLVLLLTVFLLSFLSMGILFGFNGLSAGALMWNGSKIIYMSGIMRTLAVFGLDFLMVIFYTVLAFFLSAATRSRSLSTGFALFMVLFGSTLVEIIAVFFSWGKFLPFAATDFSNTICEGARIVGVTLNFSILSTLIYLLIMLISGYLIFKKRDV